MIRIAQYSYAGLAWALVVAIVLQVFFIGLGLFASREYVNLHGNFGWILHFAPVLVVVAAAAAGAGRASIGWAIVMAIVIWFVPILAALRGLPVAAAFHPLLAISALLLAVAVASSALRLARDGGTSTTTVWQWLLVAAVVAIILFLSFAGSPEPA